MIKRDTRQDSQKPETPEDVGKLTMRVNKKIFSLTLILLCTSLVGITPFKSKTKSNPTNPTLITLKWKSSEILTDSEGHKPFKRFKPSNLFNIWPERVIKHQYIEHLNFEIVQINENSFEVLGSPIEWEQDLLFEEEIKDD